LLILGLIIVVAGIAASAAGQLPQPCYGPNCPEPQTMIARPVLPSTSATPHPAVVRLSAPTGRAPGERGVGGGTLVWSTGGDGIVITAEHVVGNQMYATVKWPSGYCSTGRVLGTDPDADLAAVLVTPPKNAATLPIAAKSEHPGPGDAVRMFGFAGPTDRQRVFAGRVLGYVNRTRCGRHHTIRVDGTVWSGDSGGPILFEDKVCGVIYGGPHRPGRRDTRPIHGACGVRIREFLRRVAPHCLTQPAVRPGVVPVPKPPTPGPSQPAKPAGVCVGIAAMRAELVKLRAELVAVRKLAATAKQPGPPGRAGKDGKDGAPGAQGPPGKDGKDGAPAPIGTEPGGLVGALRIRVTPVPR